MAIESWGYPSTLPPGEAFFRWFNLSGRRYAVWGASDLKVAIKSGGTRQVTVANGWAQGGGITDKVSGGPIDVAALPNPPAAGSIYHLVGIQRDWATNTSTLVTVAGTSSRAIPSRSTGAGVTQDVQPLALVRITRDNPTPTEVVDLRVVGSEAGTMTIFDDLALDYLGAYIGTEVRNANTGRTWKRVINSSGTAAWEASDFAKLEQIGSLSGYAVLQTPSFRLVLRESDGKFYGQKLVNGTWTNTFVIPADGGLISGFQVPESLFGDALEVVNSGISNEAGWSVSSAVANQYLMRQGAYAHARVSARRSGSTIASNDATGGVSDVPVFTITDSRFKPRYTHPAPFYYYTSGRSTYGGFGRIDTSGEFRITSLAPGADLAQTTSIVPSLILSTTYPVAD